MALPGLSHRTGHGIGMTGMSRPISCATMQLPCRPGCAFRRAGNLHSREFGIRLEDCWFMTEAGPKPFHQLAKSIDQPI